MLFIGFLEVEVDVDPGVREQPRFDVRVLVGGMVVHDQMLLVGAPQATWRRRPGTRGTGDVACTTR